MTCHRAREDDTPVLSELSCSVPRMVRDVLSSAWKNRGRACWGGNTCGESGVDREPCRVKVFLITVAARGSM
jgi:hypothetical protein